MKKVIVILFVFLVCSLSLFSVTLYYTGDGRTEKEAYSSALESLMREVSLSLSYSSLLDVHDNGEEGSTRAESELLSVPSYLDNLPDIGSVSSKTTESGYRVTLSFSQADSGKIKAEAEALVNVIDRSGKTTAHEYEDAFESWSEYDGVSYIAASVGVDIPSPVSDRAVEKVKFASVLWGEEDLLKYEFSLPRTGCERKNEIDERLLALEDISRRYCLPSSVRDSMPSPESLVSAIEEQKKQINVLFRMKEVQVGEYIKKAESEIKAVEDEISSRGWTRFDYDSTGKVSDNSKNKREAERKDRTGEIIKLLRNEEARLEKTYISQVTPLLKTLSDNAEALLRSSCQTASTQSGRAGLTVGDYDASEQLWPYTLTLHFPFGEISFSGKISLEEAFKVLGEDFSDEDYSSRVKGIHLSDAVLKAENGILGEASYTIRPSQATRAYSISAGISLSSSYGIFHTVKAEKEFSLESSLPVSWRFYGFGSSREEAVKSAESAAGEYTGSSDYIPAAGNITAEDVGTLCSAVLDITQDTAISLFERVRKNDETLLSSEIGTDIAGVREMTDESEKIIHYLGSLGFFFTHENVIPPGLVGALYSEYCAENGIAGSASGEEERDITALSLERVGTCLDAGYCTMEDSSDISSHIEKIENIKKEAADAKAEVLSGLEEERNRLNAELESKLAETEERWRGVTVRDSRGTDVTEYTKERRLDSIKEDYEEELPLSLYVKEQQLLSRYSEKENQNRFFSRLEEAKNELDNSFRVNSDSSSSLSLSFGEADLENGRKYFVLTLDAMGEKFRFSDYVDTCLLFSDASYSSVSEMGVGIYSSYKERMGEIDYLQSLSPFFEAEITYSITLDDSDMIHPVYTVLLSSLRIIRRDTGDTVYEKDLCDNNILVISPESYDYSRPQETVEKPEGYSNLELERMVENTTLKQLKFDFLLGFNFSADKYGEDLVPTGLVLEGGLGYQIEKLYLRVMYAFEMSMANNSEWKGHTAGIEGLYTIRKNLSLGGGAAFGGVTEGAKSGSRVFLSLCFCPPLSSSLEFNAKARAGLNIASKQPWVFMSILFGICGQIGSGK